MEATCTGLSIATPCASNDDRSPRPFFFCVLSGPGGSMVTNGFIATAQQLFRPVTNDILGIAVYVECVFEVSAANVVAMLGVADGPSITGKTAELKVYHYVTGADAAPPNAATVGTDGAVLQFNGQPGGDVISFAFEPSTQNPTLNPTSNPTQVILQHGFLVGTKVRLLFSQQALLLSVILLIILFFLTGL